MVTVKTSVYITLACLISMPCMQMYAITQNQLKYLLALTSAGASIVGTWAYAERTQKLELKTKVSKLAQELASFKSDQVKIKQDQEFLALLAQRLVRIEQEYTQELALFKGANYSEQEIVRLMRILQARVRIKAGSTGQLKAAFEHDLQELVGLEQKLKIKKSEWLQDNKAHSYKIQAERLHERLQHLALFLKALQVALDTYSPVLDLANVLAYDYQVLYAVELQLQTYHDKQDIHNYTRELDQHIRARYSEAMYQFPYLAYAEHVKRDLEVLQKAIEQVQASSIMHYTQELEHKALPLVKFLEQLLKFVVTTPTYIKEKTYKPEFDHHEAQIKMELQEKQERLTAELHESKARIEREKKLVEAQLQAERNRAQELINKKGELELERRNLECKDNQIMFELARIRDGETIKEVLKQNNNEWHYKYNALQNTNARLKDRLEYIRADTTRELDKLQIEANKLKANLTKSETEVQKLTQKAQELQAKMQRSTDILRQLETYEPPFNPEMVEGLSNYIRTIKSYAGAAHNALT